MKLIDKDALVAEIEKRIKSVEKRLKRNNSYSEEGVISWERDKSLYDSYNQFLSFIDSLDVKEVGISIPNIDDTLKEEGLDPDSKEAKVFKESYYLALEKLKAQKGE